MFDVVFIEMDGCEEGGGEMFEGIIECGMWFWLVRIGEVKGNLWGSIWEEGNRFIEGDSLGRGRNRFNRWEMGMVGGDW